MSFPQRLLNPGEEVVVDVRPHWWFLVRPLTAVVVVLIGGIVALSQSAPEAADLAVLAVLVVALVWLLGRYVRWATTSLVVTNDRIVLRRGVVGKQSREIPIEHLSDISYRQSIFQRLIGTGSLLFESAGRDSREVFPGMPHPARIQNEIYGQMNLRRSPGGARLSIPEQLEKLDDLRRRGVISDSEFNAEKERLLSRG